MDPLNHLLAHFSLQVGVFYTGNICGVHDFEQDAVCGYLHLIQSGSVDLLGRGAGQHCHHRTPAAVFAPARHASTAGR